MGIIFSTRKKKQIETSNGDNDKTIIYSTAKSPEAIWPYNKAYTAWNLLFCSWQIWLDPDSMAIVEWWIERETRQVCRNISWVLSEFWVSLKDVVKTTIYLTNIENFDKVNKVYKDYFILKPARTTVEVSWLPKWALVEIEVIAKLK